VELEEHRWCDGEVGVEMFVGDVDAELVDELDFGDVDARPDGVGDRAGGVFDRAERRAAAPDCCGRPASWSVTRVMTASVPSLPMRSSFRL
jgi:hypothetical protein